jgi:hypothetical protein
LPEAAQVIAKESKLTAFVRGYCVGLLILPVPLTSAFSLISIADTTGAAVNNTATSMETAMSTVNWEQEKQRFMAVAYDGALRAANRAFKRWHRSKREDAQAEFIAKLWDQWKRLLERGKDPEPLLYPLLFWAKQWCYQDRRLSGRPRNIDIQDYRSKMTAHFMDGRGKLEPHDRSDRRNAFMDWTGAARTDDPSDLASALEQTGLTLETWLDL